MKTTPSPTLRPSQAAATPTPTPSARPLLAAMLLAAALCAGATALSGCTDASSDDLIHAQSASTDPAVDENDDVAGDENSYSGDSALTDEQLEDLPEGSSDADAPNGSMNSVSTDFYTAYFGKDLQADVDETYESGSTLSAGCITTVEKDGKTYYQVGAFSTDWGPQGDFYTCEVGVTKDSAGNDVGVWVYGPCDAITQEEVNEAAAYVEVR